MCLARTTFYSLWLQYINKFTDNNEWLIKSEVLIFKTVLRMKLELSYAMWYGIGYWQHAGLVRGSL